MSMEENRNIEESSGGFSLCQSVRERLPDLLEGYLDAMAAEAIRAHLASCFLCQAEYKSMAETIRLVESLPFVDSGRDFAPAIMAALRGQSEHSFQAPVVEMEAEASLRLLTLPRITNGHQRLFGFWPAMALLAA